MTSKSLRPTACPRLGQKGLPPAWHRGPVSMCSRAGLPHAVVVGLVEALEGVILEL